MASGVLRQMRSQEQMPLSIKAQLIYLDVVPISV